MVPHWTGGNRKSLQVGKDDRLKETENRMKEISVDQNVCEEEKFHPPKKAGIQSPLQLHRTADTADSGPNWTTSHLLCNLLRLFSTGFCFLEVSLQGRHSTGHMTPTKSRLQRDPVRFKATFPQSRQTELTLIMALTCGIQVFSLPSHDAAAATQDQLRLVCLWFPLIVCTNRSTGTVLYF